MEILAPDIFNWVWVCVCVCLYALLARSFVGLLLFNRSLHGFQVNFDEITFLGVSICTLTLMVVTQATRVSNITESLFIACFCWNRCFCLIFYA